LTFCYDGKTIGSFGHDKIRGIHGTIGRILDTVQQNGVFYNGNAAGDSQYGTTRTTSMVYMDSNLSVPGGHENNPAFISLQAVMTY
jgi:hypothetical protein